MMQTHWSTRRGMRLTLFWGRFADAGPCLLRLLFQPLSNISLSVSVHAGLAVSEELFIASTSACLCRTRISRYRRRSVNLGRSLLLVWGPGISRSVLEGMLLGCWDMYLHRSICCVYPSQLVHKTSVGVCTLPVLRHLLVCCRALVQEEPIEISLSPRRRCKFREI